MAVYNGEKFIHAAIESILGQTFKDFELLIINDGSTDNSASIVNKYADKRIRLLHNDENRGLAFTRNRGVEEAQGKFFATLDCDDIACKNRLNLQLNFFSGDKQSVLCGGRIKFINDEGKIKGKFSSLKGDEDFLKSLLLFNNIYCNSTTMIRTDVLKEFRYESAFAPAEDYDLFERISKQYSIGFINKFLCYYRVHDTNISTRKSDKRINAEIAIAKRQLDYYGFKYTQKEFDLHTKFTTTRLDFISDHLSDYTNWFGNLIEQNKIRKRFKEDSFKQALARQWARVCLYQIKSGHNLKAILNKGNFSYTDIIISFIKSI